MHGLTQACHLIESPYPDWGILGQSPKRLPCQHGTVCRKSVSCGRGGAAVPPAPPRAYFFAYSNLQRLQPSLVAPGSISLSPSSFNCPTGIDVVLGDAQEAPNANNRIGYCFLRGNDQILHLADLVAAAVVHRLVQDGFLGAPAHRQDLLFLDGDAKRRWVVFQKWRCGLLGLWSTGVISISIHV